MNETIAALGRAVLCTGALGLAACNFDASSSADSPQAPQTPSGANQPVDGAGGHTNLAPQIAGSPRSAIEAGDHYEFTPSATDADGDKLTFSIAGKPSWAQFSAATGLISGTPGVGDVGSYEDIAISVSDGATARTLPAFAIAVVAEGSASGSVTLAWEPPTHNTDGSPLTNLSGYRIRYGTQSGHYDQTIDVDNAGVTRYVVDSLAPGRYFFAICAVSSKGAESDPSSEASQTI